jgi:hypothetical protein
VLKIERHEIAHEGLVFDEQDVGVSPCVCRH